MLQHKFEDAFTVDKESWGIRRNIKMEDIYSMEELISLIVSVGNIDNISNIATIIQGR